MPTLSDLPRRRWLCANCTMGPCTIIGPSPLYLGPGTGGLARRCPFNQQTGTAAFTEAESRHNLAIKEAQ